MIRNILNLQESAMFDARWQFQIDADDLTTTATGTAQTFNLIPLAIGDIVRYACSYLKTPFKHVGDTAFNTCTMSLGDSGSATRFWSAIECNANGTSILETQGPASQVTPYTAANNLILTINSQSGKALVDIDVAELFIYAVILTPAKLSLARAAVPILTKS